MRIIEIGVTIFASAGLSCTISSEADGRVAMGMIRGAVDKTSLMEDVASRGLRNPGFASDSTLPAIGQ
jgi:hypothetical protein